MSSATNIDTYAVNGIVLYVKNGSGAYTGAFVCTSVDMTYALNNIPFATVKIGAGESLWSPSRHRQTPETLLKSILGKRAVAYSDMVACELWEAGETTSITNIKSPGRGGALQIFDGYIASGSLSYEAGTFASKTISLSIYNKAVALMAAPLGSVIDVTSQYLVRMLGAGGKTETKQKNQTAFVEDAGSIDVGDIIASEDSKPQTSSSATLDVRVANVMAKIIYAKVYNTTKAEIDASSLVYRKTILDTMFSRWRINPSPDDIAYDMKNSTLAKNFDLYFGRIIDGSLPGSSIYDSMSSVLTSNEFMLSLCPRFRSNKFKMEICPSRAWAAGRPITLPLGKITSVTSNYDPISCIQTPEVFMVQFNDAIAMDPSGESTYDASRPGVFALDPAIQKLFRQVTDPNGHGSAKLEALTRTFRCQTYRAPGWLTLLARPAGSPDMMKMLEKGDKELSQEDREILKNMETGKAADCVAKALFTHLYGSNDTCSVTLSPELRFGRSGTVLEDHIGDCVDIVFPNSTVSVRGIIDRLQYTYTCGKGQAEQSYGLSLSRVRPRNPAEPQIYCPLYRGA